ncbi:hypothetical protein DFH08DRAFT_974683 [Mycena albidolilacea]|uniref:Uncharacterized protein n=1 Tax=Mycena albidolilacea TaxID=1033008 RepID=A0AAD6Z643_9AGAR|nr:hypothetical protein DFH08DRAFT_974683 [Mycena albidolilacea]
MLREIPICLSEFSRLVVCPSDTELLQLICRYSLRTASIEGASLHPSPTVISTRAGRRPLRHPHFRPHLGCVSLLVFGWLVTFAMTILALRADGRGARLSGYPHVSARAKSALPQRPAFLPTPAVRSVLSAW